METAAETFVISREEFVRQIQGAIDAGKESERKDIRARLEILRDISPVQSQISVALSAWIHELD
jgi:hypothetical protein